MSKKRENEESYKKANERLITKYRIVTNFSLSCFQGDDFDGRKTSAASSEYGEEDLEALRILALEKLQNARVCVVFSLVLLRQK